MAGLKGPGGHPSFSLGLFSSAGSSAIRRAVSALGLCILAFMALHLTTRHPWLDLNAEHTLPTYFNSLLFLLAGLAAARSALCSRKAKVVSWPWVLLGCSMLFASVDEVVEIHEGITEFARYSTGADLRNIWMLPYVLVLAVGLWVLRPWWRNLRCSSPGAARLLLVGVVCWLVSFAAELTVRFEVLPSAVWRLAVCLEEGLEMLGALLWLWAFLSVRECLNRT